MPSDQGNLESVGRRRTWMRWVCVLATLAAVAGMAWRVYSSLPATRILRALASDEPETGLMLYLLTCRSEDSTPEGQPWVILPGEGPDASEFELGMHEGRAGARTFNTEDALFEAGTGGRDVVPGEDTFRAEHPLFADTVARLRAGKASGNALSGRSRARVESALLETADKLARERPALAAEMWWAVDGTSVGHVASDRVVALLLDLVEREVDSETLAETLVRSWRDLGGRGQNGDGDPGYWCERAIDAGCWRGPFPWVESAGHAELCRAVDARLPADPFIIDRDLLLLLMRLGGQWGEGLGREFDELRARIVSVPGPQRCEIVAGETGDRLAWLMDAADEVLEEIGSFRRSCRGDIRMGVERLKEWCVREIYAPYIQAAGMRTSPQPTDHAAVDAIRSVGVLTKGREPDNADSARSLVGLRWGTRTTADLTRPGSWETQLGEWQGWSYHFFSLRCPDAFLVVDTSSSPYALSNYDYEDTGQRVTVRFMAVTLRAAIVRRSDRKILFANRWTRRAARKARLLVREFRLNRSTPTLRSSEWSEYGDAYERVADDLFAALDSLGLRK